MTTPPRTELPTISVVTPSFNQAEFLPRCIASVADQTHPAHEHLVYDPGSTDGSRDIAAVAPTVHLIAEPDDGQASAVAAGCRRATGDIIAWLNSDDRYATPEVFEQVAKRFAEPDHPDVVYGRGRYEAPDGEVLAQAYIFDEPAHLKDRLKAGVGILQPAVFIRRSVMNELGGTDASLHYAMDYDLWIRLAESNRRFAFLDAPLAVAVVHDAAKTEDGSGGSLAEAISLVQKHYGFVSWSWALGQARSEVLGAHGVILDPETPDETRRVARRAQEIFDGYNRNPRAILRLVRPPWDRPSASALSHLVRRVRS